MHKKDPSDQKKPKGGLPSSQKGSGPRQMNRPTCPICKEENPLARRDQEVVYALQHKQTSAGSEWLPLQEPQGQE